MTSAWEYLLTPPASDDDETQTLIDETDYQVPNTRTIQVPSEPLISKDSSSDDGDTHTVVDEADYQLHKRWAIQRTPAALISKESRQQLECLIYDMRTYSTNVYAQERLSNAKNWPYYLGPPYISAALGIEILKSKWPHKKTNCKGYLEQGIALKGGRYGPSTLAPALAAYLQIGTEFEENEAFRAYYRLFSHQTELCLMDVSLVDVRSGNKQETL
jgi:hypothetical protein